MSISTDLVMTGSARGWMIDPLAIVGLVQFKGMKAKKNSSRKGKHLLCHSFPYGEAHDIWEMFCPE